MELALQVKVGKVASFVGKILVVRPPTTKITNILPHENYTLYGIVLIGLQFFGETLLMCSHVQSCAVHVQSCA